MSIFYSLTMRAVSYQLQIKLCNGTVSAWVLSLVAVAGYWHHILNTIQNSDHINCSHIWSLLCTWYPISKYNPNLVDIPESRILVWYALLIFLISPQIVIISTSVIILGHLKATFNPYHHLQTANVLDCMKAQLFLYNFLHHSDIAYLDLGLGLAQLSW